MFEVTKTQVNNAFKPEIIESTNIILKQARPFVQMSYRFDGDLSNLSDDEAIKKVLDAFYKEHYQHKIEHEKLVELELDVAKTKEREQETNKKLDNLNRRTEEVAQATSRLINIEDLTDEQKDNYLKLYPQYEMNRNYNPGDTFRHQGIAYEVIQSHISQEDWTPESVPALYKKVLNDTVTDDAGNVTDIIQDFVQPSGAHDAYHTGDKVLYFGDVYESLIDNNVHSPADYSQGWKIYEESEESEEESEESEEESEDVNGGQTENEIDPPEFIQPQGAHDAYQVGEKVMFEDRIYQSSIDNNVYSPSDYPPGWEVI